MERKLSDAASQLPETDLTFDRILIAAKPSAAGRSWRALATLAACCILLISIGFGTYAYAAERQEYSEAVQFFEDHGLSADGLTRREIKTVYQDITTKSFSYAKTAEVIQNSLTTDQIGGYEISQEDPTPEDVENLWNLIYQSGESWHGTARVRYAYRSEYKMDDQKGFEVHDKSYFEKYDGDTLIWSVCIPEFWVNDYSIISDGVIAYGETYRWSSDQTSNAWMVKIDSNGNQIWKCMLDHGFEDEYIAAVIENADGSYAVISRGDLKYFCLSQYTADGKQTDFQKTKVGNYGIWNAVGFGDGYLVQLGNYMTNEHARIIKVDHAGNITESFSYGGEDAYYYITDMIEFDGRIYLSAYAVPRRSDADQNAGSRYEIDAILNYLFDNEIWEISSEELTPMVRDNYTAMLLVCDPTVGTPREFYSVKGSLGGKLSLSDSGMLLWDVQSITSTSFSPMTSAYTIRGECYVFRYTFDNTGALIQQDKTDEIAYYSR